MTVRLSRHKVTGLLRRYFQGMAQTQIAGVVGVNQSSISVYASRFSERSEKMGLAAAGEE